MVDFTLRRSAEVFVEHDLSEEDRFAILDWILGELSGLETDRYATICKYPEQIERISVGIANSRLQS